MMADTLAFQVSPSHLPDQPPKMTRQQVFKSKIQAESSLQHQETVVMVSCALCPLTVQPAGPFRCRGALAQLVQVAFQATCDAAGPQSPSSARLTLGMVAAPPHLACARTACRSP